MPPPRDPDDPLAGLTRWLAEGRVDAAAAERARQRWLERQAGEEATLAGVLLDLGERGRPVTVTTAGGHRVTGSLTVVGADFCAVRDDRGQVVVPHRSMASVRPAPGDPPADGERPGGLELVLAEALAELAVDRPLVAVATGADEHRGTLRAVGFDVLTLMLDGPTRGAVHVPIGVVDVLIVTR